MIVGLTHAQYAAAQDVGRTRQGTAESQGKSAVCTFQDGGGDNIDRHTLGAVAEYALAVYFGVLEEWQAESATRPDWWNIPADVGANLHVRATRHARGGLVVHPRDQDDGVFILATVNGPDVTFIGWLYGREAKRPEYWRCHGPGWSRRPAFCVPQKYMRPLDTIPKEAIHHES